MPSILPGGFAEHLAGGNCSLVLPSILPGGFAMLSAMHPAGGNPLSVNLTSPSANYITLHYITSILYIHILRTPKIEEIAIMSLSI